jgi:hypothetical protein
VDKVQQVQDHKVDKVLKVPKVVFKVDKVLKELKVVFKAHKEQEDHRVVKVQQVQDLT